MAGSKRAKRGVETRLEAIGMLRLMYVFFQEQEETEAAREKEDKKWAKYASSTAATAAIHRLAYSTEHEAFIAKPYGATDDVDALQLLELIDLAECYDIPIHIDGMLVDSYVPATFIVNPSGCVEVLLTSANDVNLAWYIIETEYAAIGTIEVGLE